MMQGLSVAATVPDAEAVEAVQTGFRVVHEPASLLSTNVYNLDQVM